MDTILNEHLISLLKSKNDPVDFLLKRVVLNSSAVLIGCKPACTIMFNNFGPERSTLAYWYEYKEFIFKNAKLKYFELYKSNDRVLVLVYDEIKLEMVLGSHEVLLFLNSLGYNKNQSLNDMLTILKHKFSYCIPHEIGVFLGLPLKDVMGFMGLTNLSCSFTMGWKIYGDIDTSISLYKHYKMCRDKIINMLINNVDPRTILQKYP